jgi:FkbM family methyltransferase
MRRINVSIPVLLPEWLYHTLWRLKRKISAAPTPFARWLLELVNPAAREARIEREYDDYTVQIMSRILKRTSNCLDVGCNWGYFLEYILRHAPSGNHYAFEPLPDLAARLKQRFPYVNIMQMALSDSTGQAAFYHVLDNHGYSGLKITGLSKNLRTEKLGIETRRLDDILPYDYKVDFIKVDVEGAELQVFRGAIQTIRKCKPFIVFEHGTGAADYYGTSPDQVYEFLVNTCELSISQLGDWLFGKSPLTRDAFISLFETHTAWYFLAHPRK